MSNIVIFNAEAAERIILDFKLPRTTLKVWKQRGAIPDIYFTVSVPIPLLVNGEVVTKPLFFWRVRMGLKQAIIAKLCNVSVMTVSHWERGTRNPKKAELVQLTTYFQKLTSTL